MPEENLKKDCYLIVGCSDPDRWNPHVSLRLTSKKPSLKAHERAIKLALCLPVSLFVTPSLVANITVDDESVTPQTLEADVLENISEALESVRGVTIDLRVVDPEED